MLKVGVYGVRRRHESAGDLRCHRRRAESRMPEIDGCDQQQSEAPMRWSGRESTESRRCAFHRRIMKAREAFNEAFLEKRR